MTEQPTYRCDIRGDAIATSLHDSWVWVRADPDIHIADEVLNGATPEALEFLTAMYEIGTWCDAHQAWHGHRKTPTEGVTDE